MKIKRSGVTDEEIILFALETANNCTKNPDKTIKNQQLARVLLREFFDLDGLLTASYDRLVGLCGKRNALYLYMQRDIRRGFNKESRIFKGRIRTSADASKFAVEHFNNDQFERFYIIYIRENGKIFSCQHFDMQTNCRCGSRASIPIMYNVIMEQILEHNPHSVFFCHTHPLSSPEPSQSDFAVNARLSKCLEFLNIGFIDHVITGKDKSYCLMSEYEKSRKDN